MKYVEYILLFVYFLLITSQAKLQKNDIADESKKNKDDNLNKNQVTYEKVGVFEIFRHGARTPKGLDKITSKLIYGTEKMQLTQNGFRQHYVLGKILRLFKYKNLLSKPNLSKNILISPKERCIYSAVAQVNGLFPNENIIFENLNESVDLRNDDYPPGYQEYMKTIDNNYIKNLKEKNRKQKSNKLREDENSNELEKLTKLKIVDPYKNIYFHPDKCVFYKHQKLVISSNKNDTSTVDETSKIQPENEDQSTNEINRKNLNRYNFKEKEDMEEDIEDIPSEYSVMKPSLSFIQKKVNKFRKRDINTKSDSKKEDKDNSAKKENENDKNIKEIFEINNEQIKVAVDSIEKSLISAFKEKINEDEWVLNKNDEKYSYNHLGKLVHFIVPLRYHFNNETGKRLTFNKEVERTIKIVMINHFYSKKLNESIEKRLLFTELMRDIIVNLKSMIENNNYSINLYSGHDTTLVNMIVNLLDVNKIRPLLEKSVDGNNDELYNSFIPPFASNIILEVTKKITSSVSSNSSNTNYYLRMFYNNKEVKENWISEIEYGDNGIELNQFIKVYENLLVNTSNGNWECEDDI